MDQSGPGDPADAFSLVADETRIAILRALGEAPQHEGDTQTQAEADTDSRAEADTQTQAEADAETEAEAGDAVPFTELRERVGVPDSGKFNYHLGKLVGTFVRRTDEGYALNYPGELLYRTVIAGFFTRRAALSGADADGDCADCGGSLRMEYDESVLRVACPDCGRDYMGVEFPPSAVEARAGEDLPTAFDQWVRHNLLLASRGVCTWCAGRMPAEITLRESDGPEPAAYVGRNCEHCGGSLWTTPGENVLYHPAVVSFFHERGADVTSRPLWELGFVTSDDAVTVRSEEPWELAVTATCDGDELRLVLDGDANVVGVEKSE
jgi:predicted  nucleic acid-binding Zn-ribbon protein